MICDRYDERHVDVAREIGTRLCQAWGFDAGQVLDITIYFTPDQLPRADISVLLNEQVVRHVLDLVPRPSDDVPS